MKNSYFAGVRYASLPNAYLVRLRSRRSTGVRLIHLGSGSNYIEGMTNVEGNLLRKKDLWLDLRNPLPFANESAEFVYCSHTLEHLYPDEAVRLLKEVRRILTATGVARIAVPSMEFALDIASGRSTDLFPRSFKDPLAQAVNYLFCDGQHKYGYSQGLLEEFAEQAGFADVRKCPDLELRTYSGITVGREYVGSLVVELFP